MTTSHNPPERGDPPASVPTFSEQEDLTPSQLRELGARLGRKIHMHNSDPYLYGWGKTDCGRRLKPGMLITIHGIDTATCEACREMRDFGYIRRAC